MTFQISRVDLPEYGSPLRKNLHRELKELRGYRERSAQIIIVTFVIILISMLITNRLWFSCADLNASVVNLSTF